MNSDVNICDDHFDQIINLFCEEHFCTLCNVCKIIEHKHCQIRKIEDIVIERNIKKEFETRIADLTELYNLMKECQRETQSKIQTYTDTTKRMRQRIVDTQEGLNKIFDKYKSDLDSKHDHDNDILHAKLISYQTFQQKLERHLDTIKAHKTKSSDDSVLFILVVKLKEVYTKFKHLSENVSSSMATECEFSITDVDLPRLIEELMALRNLIVSEEPANAVGHASQLQEEQTSKADESLYGVVGAPRNNDTMLASGQSQPVQTLNENDAYQRKNVDHVSSDELCEPQDELSFEDIKCCKLLESVQSWFDPTNACLISNARFLVCGLDRIGIFSIDKPFVNLDEEITLKTESDKPGNVVMIDNGRAVVSIREKNTLQIIQVTPNLQLGEELRINCFCDGLASYQKQLYVYTKNLEDSASRQYSKFQLVSLDGEVIKHIQLLDMVHCFNVDKSGNIIYFGCERSSTDNFIKCVSVDGRTQFQYSRSETPSAIIPDNEGNAIICCHITGKVAVIKPDGSFYKELISNFQEKFDWFVAFVEKCKNILYFAYSYEYLDDIYREGVFWYSTSANYRRIEKYQINFYKT